MGMTIDEAISHLDTYSSTMGSGQTTQEQHEDAKRVAIATMRKYQKLEQEPTTKNDLGVDCVVRQDVERFIEGFINEYTPEEELEFINLELNGLKHLPSVTPQEPRCKECKWWKDSDGEYRRGCGAESKCPINRREVFEGNGYCYLFELQESEVEE